MRVGTLILAQPAAPPGVHGRVSEERTPPVRLTSARLDDLLDLLTRLGSPVAAHLNPGLAPPAVLAHERASGRTLPAEARTWWAWRNGLSGGAPGGLGPWDFPTLHDALALAAEHDATEREIDEDGVWWSIGWLPLVCARGMQAADSSAEVAGRVPIRRLYDQGVEAPPDPDFASFGDLVELWIEALDCGYWTWQGTIDPDRQPPGRVFGQL